VRPQVAAKQPPTPAEKALSIARKYATLLAIGLCLVLIAPTWTRHMSDNIRTRPLASLGLGLAGIVGLGVLLAAILTAMIIVAVMAGLVQLTGLVPVVIVLGLFSAVTLVVGFWFFAAYLAEIVLGYFAGRWIVGLGSRTLAANRFVSLIMGLILLALISALPYVGPVVGWLAVLFALGAFVIRSFWKCPAEPSSLEKPKLVAE